MLFIIVTFVFGAFDHVVRESEVRVAFRESGLVDEEILMGVFGVLPSGVDEIPAIVEFDTIPGMFNATCVATDGSVSDAELFHEVIESSGVTATGSATDYKRFISTAVDIVEVVSSVFGDVIVDVEDFFDVAEVSGVCKNFIGFVLKGFGALLAGDFFGSEGFDSGDLDIILVNGNDLSVTTSFSSDGFGLIIERDIACGAGI